jgi:hypothetical protein
MRNNRIYYRNPFFHLGHLQTLFHNDDFATSNKSKCYMLIDDRYTDYISSIEEDIRYLNLKSTVLISMRKYTNIIHNETKKLAAAGKIYMLLGKNMVSNAGIIGTYIDSCPAYFQLKYTGTDTVIGFVKPDDERGTGLKIIYLFEYIVKICDNLFNITDVSCDLPESFKAGPPLNPIVIQEYIIEDFRYTKKHWPTEQRADPCLLTLKGLKARGVPSTVLWDFYRFAVVKGRVSLFDFEDLLLAHLRSIAEPLQAIIEPLLLKLKDEDPLYIPQAAIGLDRQHLHKNGSAYLAQNAGAIKCTDIEMNRKSIQALLGERINGSLGASEWPCLDWLPVTAARPFTLHICNWFYTGLNDILTPIITKGVYTGEGELTVGKIYTIKDGGFMRYSHNDDLGPVFLSICKV